jgi:N4-gp56 family major capsid protein
LTTITDLTQAIDLINTVQLYVKTMGADAALHLDDVIRNGIVSGLKDSDAKFGADYFERFAGASNTGDSSTDFATFHALSAANGKITRAVHLGCVTQLKAAKVPMIGGKYVAITPPQVVHDMRQDTTWTNAATNADPEKLYKRLALMLDGCAFVEATNPFREGATYGTYSASGANFNTIYLGEGAFGCPELSDKRAGGSPMAPKMVVLAQPDKSDPLNLKTTIGWKAMYGCKLLIATTDGTTPASWEKPRALVLRTKSTFA